jgi:tetratricopeptide (TPR) repeat protein
MPNASPTIESNQLLSIQDLEWLVERLESHVDKSLIDDLSSIIEAETPQERVELAERVLAEDSTGFAHLVLAIGTDNLDKQKQHYQKAIDTSRKVYLQQTPVSFILGHATVGLSKTLWNQNKRDEAIKLLEGIDLDNLHVGQNLIDIISYSLVTYLIIQNQDERAREILDRDPVPTFEWFYLNALLRFRQHGDSFISRGAFAAALVEDELVPHFLTNTEYDTAVDESDLDDIEPWSEIYANLTRESWLETPDAIDWLKRMSEEKPRVGDSESIDKARARRIDDEVQLASAHLSREDYKNAKRSFNSALREANRLNDGGVKFTLIMVVFIQLLEENEDSIAPAIEMLKQRAAWLDGQASKAGPEALMRSYLDIAKLLELNSRDSGLSESCAQKAYDLFKGIRSTSDSFLEDTILTLLGSAALIKGDVKALESIMRSSIENSEQMFGPKHLHLVDQLQFLRYALHEQGRHEEEIETANRVYSIDVQAHKDDNFEGIEWCQVPQPND